MEIIVAVALQYGGLAAIFPAKSFLRGSVSVADKYSHEMNKHGNDLRQVKSKKIGYSYNKIRNTLENYFSVEKI